MSPHQLRLPKLPFGWIILGLTIAAWSPFIGVAYAWHTATLHEMQAQPKLYTPTACTASPCVLTGLGGFIETWDDWADAVMRRGWGFIVRGTCASACEREFERALRAGVSVDFVPGAVLIPHRPEPVT
jgi:hypothetical protein